MTSGHNLTDADMDCGGFFDHIDDFLDVPNDEMPIDLDTFPCIGSGVGVETDRSSPEAFPCSDSGSSDISVELSVPYEDIVQLEWLSSFFEDSFSGSGGGSTLALDKPPKGSPGKHLSDHRFRTSSPISVMDSSSSCSAVKTSTVTVAPSHCGRARSKRPRPKTVNFRPIMVPPPASGSETCAESSLVIKILKESNPEHKNKMQNKKIKITLPAPTPTDGDRDLPSHPIRKCLHCEITKTPQWRAGPMGPKTLCNACGVRYKSGRLFPEYRPAASPTFVSTVHSNSHKKVLEMRNKAGGGRAVKDIIGGSAAMEQIPNARVSMDCV